MSLYWQLNFSMDFGREKPHPNHNIALLDSVLGKKERLCKSIAMYRQGPKEGHVYEHGSLTVQLLF
jgi:hypothetical protein